LPNTPGVQPKIRVPRWLWRRRDHELGPVIVAVFVFPLLVGLTAIAPFDLVPRTLELLECAAAGAGIAWCVAEPDHSGSDRAVGPRVAGPARPAEQRPDRAGGRRALPCHHCRSHRRPRPRPKDYQSEESTPVSSFRSPLTIVQDTPGRLELRIEHEET
jgi:hypothetical protein